LDKGPIPLIVEALYSGLNRRNVGKYEPIPLRSSVGVVKLISRREHRSPSVAPETERHLIRILYELPLVVALVELRAARGARHLDRALPAAASRPVSRLQYGRPLGKLSEGTISRDSGLAVAYSIVFPDEPIIRRKRV
jgi:hypothetical protein